MARVAALLRRTPGCYFRKIHGSAFHAGIPDLVGCWRGHFFAVELKQEGEQPTALQVAELQKIRGARGAAVWCDNFDAFAAWWERFTRR